MGKTIPLLFTLNQLGCLREWAQSPASFTKVNSLTEPRILALRQRRDGLRDGLAERNSTTCYET